MIKEKFSLIWQELACYSKAEKLFIICAMVCGFCITADYSIIRPVSNSVFIHTFTSSFFPYAWMACVPLNFLVVALYNRYLPKFGCWKMFLVIFSSIFVGNLFFALFLKKIALLAFLFYVWKEIYILLMFQQLWSVIHATIEQKRAKYLYGILFAVGGAGGALGSLVPGFFAVKMGSESLLFASLPIYFVLAIFYYAALKNREKITGSSDLKTLQRGERGAIMDSIHLVTRSRFLMCILMIVLFMQLSSTIVDYQFNRILETNIPDKDIRTEYCGRILSVVNFATICLQIAGTFLLVHFLGLRGAHFFVPLLLCLNALGFMFFPEFALITLSYVTIKSFDFSVFNVIKEMLYIPLKLDEKFRAKAIIDVFTYRTAKAIGSFLILTFQFFSPHNLSILTFGAIAVFMLWSWMVFKLFKEYGAFAKVPASS